MVIMSRRYHSSSDSSSSDEDDGNFKRKKRENSYFIENNYCFDANNSNSNRVFDQNFKQLKTSDNLNKKLNNRLMSEQKLLETKLSSLTKYDDLSDFNSNNSNDCFTNNFDINRNNFSITNDNKSSLNCSQTLVSDKISTHFSDNINGLTSERNVESASVITELDPKLGREEAFAQKPVNQTSLKQRIRILLNSRKPSEAYNELKIEVTNLELDRYKDELMAIALDWFPSFLYNRSNPYDYIDIEFIKTFQNVMRDVFTLKTKLSKFWEELIININKFVEHSRVKDLPQLLTRLRWILIRDIREYLISEEVKISLKASTIIIDHKTKLEAISSQVREQKRREFEEKNTPLMRTIPISSTNPLLNPLVHSINPSMISQTDIYPNIALQTSAYPLIITNPQSLPSNPKQVITPKTHVPIVPSAKAQFNSEQKLTLTSTKMSSNLWIEPSIVLPKQTQTIAMNKPNIDSIEESFASQSSTGNAIKSLIVENMTYDSTFDSYASRDQTSPASLVSSSSGSSCDQQVVDQIVNLLKQDQYLRLVQMIHRHTKSDVYTIIQDFGRALRIAIHPKDSIYEVFRKLYDTLKLNSCNDIQKHNKIVERLLHEFSYTVRFNPKEWLAIRDFTRKNLQHLADNPFDEPVIPLKHNIINRCDYANASNNLVIDYEAINAEIPLIALNCILKDPRIEFRCDSIMDRNEAIEYEDEKNCGNFSPICTQTSMSPTSPRSYDSEEDLGIQSHFDASCKQIEKAPFVDGNIGLNNSIENKSVSPKTTSLNKITVDNKSKIRSHVKTSSVKRSSVKKSVNLTKKSFNNRKRIKLSSFDSTKTEKIDDKSMSNKTIGLSVITDTKSKTGSPLKKSLDLESLAQMPTEKQKRINLSNIDSSELKTIVRVINVSNDSDEYSDD